MAYAIPLFDLNFTEAEEKAAVDVVRSKWISMGAKTRDLESAFAKHLAVEHAVAVSSGTAALHLALAALGIGEGDEVIVPSMTFVATVNVVRYVGATPVFADITGPHDFSISPEHVKNLINPRTRAILPMHYAGYACDMDSLRAISRMNDLCLVEDAAHAPASMYGKRHLGTFGDVGCFSFFANKNMTCAEGGMLVTNRKEIADRARLLRSHGMTALSYERSNGHATSYDVVVEGYNYRLDDLRASLALAQLEKLESDTVRRAQLRREYVERLRGVDDLAIPYLEHSHPSSHYIFPLVLTGGGAERRDAVRNALADRGIQTSVHYPAVHRFSIYKTREARLPKTEYVADHQITLPLYGGLTEDEIDYVAGSLAAAIPECRTGTSVSARLP